VVSVAGEIEIGGELFNVLIPVLAGARSRERLSTRVEIRRMPQ
jgi:hypothetical protein